MQPVSNEVLHSFVAIVRQYGHDEFVRLLDGLKNGELTEPSEWFQAIQYLYHNNKILFFDIDEAQIENAIRHQILEPLDADLHRTNLIVEVLHDFRPFNKKSPFN